VPATKALKREFKALFLLCFSKIQAMRPSEFRHPAFGSHRISDSGNAAVDGKMGGISNHRPWQSASRTPLSPFNGRRNGAGRGFNPFGKWIRVDNDAGTSRNQAWHL